MRPLASSTAVLLALGGLTACQHVPTGQEDMLARLQRLPADEYQEPASVGNGGIYRPIAHGGGGLQLFRDHRAWQVGDIVTIAITQNAAATKNVSQNLGRTDNVTSTVANLFGLPTSFGHSSRTTQFNPNIDYSSANALHGSGATAQSDSFVSTASAIVRRILPNGDLVVAGSNEIKLVGGKEYIRIAGVVHPEDIAPGNIVPSTKVAEAHIEFSGDGVTYLAPKMGLLQHLFLTVSTLWPGDWF